MDEKPRPLPALTGVRALAGMLVVIGHLNHMGLTVEQTTKLWRRLPIFSHRTTGVGIFFALSGFVIFYNYASSLTEGGMSVGAYLWRRVARLWPLYLLAVTSFIPYGMKAHNAPIMLGTQYLGIQSWINDYRAYFTWHGGAWSVSTEAAFYVLFPFLVLPFVRRVRSARAAAGLWLGCFALLGAIWLLRFGVQRAYNGIDFWVYPFPPTRLLEFSMGAVTARLYMLRDRTPLPFRLGGLCAAGLVLALLILPGTETRPLVYPFVLVPLITPTLYWLGASSGSLAHRVLGHPFAVRAGDASYALYLFHWFGLAPTRLVLRALAVGSLTGRLAVGLPIALTLSWLVAFQLHHWVELPSQRLLLRVLHRAERRGGTDPRLTSTQAG